MFNNWNELTNYFSLYYKHIIICVFLFSVVSLVIFIVFSYLILKFLKLSIDNNNILFYQYNKKSKKIMDLYGDYNISKMYLVREPLSKFVTFMLNVFTLFNYEKLITETQDNFPYHTLILFEIKLTNDKKKWLLLEKNNCIRLTDNFLINKSQEMIEIKLKKQHTINYVLNKTQQRLGNDAFFNWHLYKNNCHKFTKEILKTVCKYNKTNKEFIFRDSDKLMKLIIPSEFTLHISQSLCVVYNIIEKYIYDSSIFNKLTN